MRSLPSSFARHLPAVALALLTAGGASASSITLASTFDAGLTFPAQPCCLSISNLQWVAVPFQPSVTATLDTADVGIGFVKGTGFLIDIDTNAGGAPGSLLETLPLPGISLIPFVGTGTSTLHPLLTAGTTYWLVLRPGSQSAGGWAQNDRGINGFVFSVNNGSTWLTTTQATPIFDINGTPTGVPEPSTLGMILIGVLVVTIAGRGCRLAAK